MSRRRAADKREVIPDAKYGDTVLAKFINSVMEQGKKGVAERIVYGALDGFDPKQVITAKLPPAHVADDWIRTGEWHPFAVRDSALRQFDNDGKRTSRH